MVWILIPSPSSLKFFCCGTRCKLYIGDIAKGHSTCCQRERTQCHAVGCPKVHRGVTIQVRYYRSEAPQGIMPEHQLISDPFARDRGSRSLNGRQAIIVCHVSMHAPPSSSSFDFSTNDIASSLFLNFVRTVLKEFQVAFEYVRVTKLGCFNFNFE